MNVLAVTAYNKPDLLFLYLEQIYRQKEIEAFKVRVYTETGYDVENDEVIKFYKNKLPRVDIKLVCSNKHPICPLVGFHNILNSYRLASAETTDFVIIGEEDIIPSSDYLRYNTFIYSEFLKNSKRIFCAAHKRRPETEMFGAPNVLIADYQLTSPSVVSKYVIDKYISPLLTEDLFVSPVEFYHRNFNCRIPPNVHTHHDGFLERVMLKHNMFALKPDFARTMHVGLSGIFCKGLPPHGDFKSRVEEWRLLIQDGEALRSRSSHPEDMTVIPLEAPEWDSLVIDSGRTLAKCSSWHYDYNNDFLKYEGI